MIEAAASTAAHDTPLVHIVDDDAGVLSALTDLFASVGYDVATYASPAQYLLATPSDRPCCLVLDVRLPGVNGLDFQEQLVREGRQVPVVLVSGHGDVPMTVRGMKAGAVDFIEKPFREQDLLDAVAAAVQIGRQRASLNERRDEAQRRFARLSRREREVLELALAGNLNKQIAYQLAIAQVTVKIHRASAMRKLGVRSLVEVARLVDAMGE